MSSSRVWYVILLSHYHRFFFFFQAEDGIRDIGVTGVQTCALPIWARCPTRSPTTPPARCSSSAPPDARGRCRSGPARPGRALDDLRHLRAEALAPETAGVAAQLRRVQLERLEGLDRRLQALRPLLAEEHTRLAVEHRLRGTTHRVGDHGHTGGLGLDGDDAEVLLAREQQGARAAQQPIALERRNGAQIDRKSVV